MKALLVNHDFTPDWLNDYPDIDYHIIDQSESKDWLKDFPQERITYVENVGNADYAKLCWLVDNYYDLPDIFIWGKTNLFKYITKEEFDVLKEKNEFAPLLTQNHKTYSDKFGSVCYYAEGMYYERNDSWYSHQFAHRHGLTTYSDFAKYMNLTSPGYIPFPPGGNFILTKDRVYRYSRDFYEKMADILPHDRLPAEAHYCERTYYSLWK